MPAHRLTSRIVASAKPAEKPYQLWDQDTPGLWVRIQPSGHKTYGIDYRMPPGRAGRKRHFKLGDCAAMTLEQARVLASEYLLRIRHHGMDPATQRQAAAPQVTIAQLAERYMAEHAAVRKKPYSIRMDRSNLDRHILPAMGARPVAAITRADISTLHYSLRATPAVANRCLALISHMLTMADQWGIREGENPAHGIPQYKAKKRERYLSEEELGRLGVAMRDIQEAHAESSSFVACIRLLILTGARLGEIRTLQWDYLDWARGIANLPDSKTGAKALRLPEAALEILRELPHIEGNPYVLPGKNPGQPIGHPQDAWQRLCATAGIIGVRIHDLRHTYASIAGTAGLSLPMIGALLGHSTPSVTARYTHLVGNAVTEAGEQVAVAIGKAMGQK